VLERPRLRVVPTEVDRDTLNAMKRIKSRIAALG
jgi:hypothetical protein